VKKGVNAGRDGLGALGSLGSGVESSCSRGGERGSAELEAGGKPASMFDALGGCGLDILDFKIEVFEEPSSSKNGTTA
jgi:hypothetical protein